jgi:hypothetical protein
MKLVYAGNGWEFVFRVFTCVALLYHKHGWSVSHGNPPPPPTPHHCTVLKLGDPARPTQAAACSGWSMMTRPGMYNYSTGTPVLDLPSEDKSCIVRLAVGREKAWAF